MITQKRNLLRALIFGVTLAIVSATGTQLAPLSPPPMTKPISPAAPTKWTLPAGIFSQGLGQVHEMQADGIAYDDFDDYVPYRSDEHDHFSWELIKEVLHKERRNVVISPFAVKQLLALLSEAAGNNTQTQRELMRTLTDVRAPDNVRGFYKKVLPSLKKPNPYYTLNLETKLYTDAYIEPQQRFAAIAKDFYATDIERLQFGDAVASAHSINAWCANVTHGHLQQVVTEDNVQNAVMLLINAIYFNGLWRRQFNATYPSVFFRTPTDQMRVEFMDQTEYFYHYDSSELNAQILRLPYKGKKFSMFVLLPKEKGGVDALAQNLGTENLKRMQWMMEEVKVKVALPKFKFDFNQNFKETLKTLGINEIFTDHASLPGLARGAEVARKLRVSNVLQKAGIDVNELGTEAFAATVIEIENKFGGSTAIVEFNVNRPFIFFIEEEATGNILFAGKVHEPHV